ncbi:hypothetical protein Y032_0125g1296 [Ancylostoma ceylanicum]|uniref:Uncharacterized protein n=1 Tax=Ancylostoma ceylanicum TaxID=53326 RepID=A0A016T8U3_9BILA|nr:hypothetical protein Y032_0125g1296 [Ancylostoma ceylanicum]
MNRPITNQQRTSYQAANTDEFTWFNWNSGDQHSNEPQLLLFYRLVGENVSEVVWMRIMILRWLCHSEGKRGVTGRL